MRRCLNFSGTRFLSPALKIKITQFPNGLRRKLSCQSNPDNKDTEAAIENVPNNWVSLLTSLNLEKM